MNPAVARSRELWTRLQHFFETSKWYRGNFEKWLMGRLPPGQPPSNHLVQDHLARYMLMVPQANGPTILERFVDSLPHKAGEDRALATQWRLAWDAALQIHETLAGGYRCFDLVVSRFVELGAEQVTGLPEDPKGGFLLGFVLPAGADACFMAASARFLPAEPDAHERVRAAARAVRLSYAQRILQESPTLREESLRIRRVFARRFVQRFGGAEWLTSGPAFPSQLRAFFAVLEEEGRSGDRAAADYVAWHELDMERQFSTELPPNLARAEELGVVCDENEEPLILADYGRFQRALSADDPETVPGWRKRLRGYLADPTVSDLPFRLALARDPARTVDRMRQAMELENLTREGLETMIQQAKARYLPGHRQVTWLPAPDWSAVLPPRA